MTRTARQWLSELKTQHTAAAWIPTSDLFGALRGQTVHLTGHAGEFDSLFHKEPLKNLLFGSKDSETFSPIGAFELSGHVFIAVVDQDDDYRSALDRILFVPSETLQTRLPNIAVRLDLGDSSRWDNPERNAEDPTFFSWVAAVINKPILHFGTEYSDSLYPGGVFYCDVQELQKTVIPLAEKDELTKSARRIGCNATGRPNRKM